MIAKQTLYFELGASLYTPCTHPQLDRVLNGRHVPQCRSAVLCLEDAVPEACLPQALANLKAALEMIDPKVNLKRFIRPRNPLILAQILDYSGIESIDGFVLPKFDSATEELYRNILSKHRSFGVMPTLETLDCFNLEKIQTIRRKLDKYWRSQIICLRIGGNDLLNLLGMKRMRGMTLYETPLRSTIDQLVVSFRPYGYELSAPVYDIFEDLETLERELHTDLAYGFFAKTAIHPMQIQCIECAFQNYTQRYHYMAQEVLHSEAAVFKHNGQMMEATCHSNWAERTTALATTRQ